MFPCHPLISDGATDKESGLRRAKAGLLAFLGSYWLHVLAALVIFLCFLLTRVAGFVSPHSAWDEIIWQALAWKVQEGGLGEFSLRDVSLLPTSEEPDLARFSLDPRDPNLLKALRLKGLGETYGDQLFFEPPGFAVLLGSMEGLVGGPGDTIVQGPRAFTKKSTAVVRRCQAAKLGIPLVSSFLTLVLIFGLGRMLFDAWTALIASCLYVVCPLDIISSQRLVPDPTASCFAVAMAFFSVRAHRDEFRRGSVSILAGLWLGGALLTARSCLGLLLVPWFLTSLRSGGWRIPAATTLAALTVGTWWYVFDVFETGALPLRSSSLDRPEIWAYHAQMVFQDFPLAALVAALLLPIVRDGRKRFLLAWLGSIYVMQLLLGSSSGYQWNEHCRFLPAYPALVLLLGQLLREVLAGRYPRVRSPVFRIAALAAVSVSVIRGMTVAVQAARSAAW